MAEVIEGKLNDLISDAGNANKGTERGRYLLDHSLRQYGAGRSILVDKEGRVLAGNKTLEVAADIGLDDVLIVETDGTQLVVVKRTDLDLEADPKARELAYSDNRSSETGLDWNVEQMVADLDVGVDLSAFWHDDELAEILASIAVEPAADPGPQLDKAAELQEKWQVGRGQVWEVPSKSVKGKAHRVMCGDSTVAGNVARLMGGEKAHLVYTDPPYGVAYDGGTKERDKLLGDTSTALYDPACRMAAQYSDNAAALYLWHAGVKGIAAAAAAAAAGYEIRCEIIWNKNHAQFGALSAQYKQKHEPCYYCFKRGKVVRWFGPTNEVTVWDCDRASVNEYHPTQKPPELAQRAIGNSCKRGQVVADWFLGSGATIVACEQTGRIGYGMEIEPKYVAVTLERLTGMGLEPKLCETDESVR